MCLLLLVKVVSGHKEAACVSFTFGEGCVQTQRARRMTGCRGCFGECAAKIRELEAASEIFVIVNIRKILPKSTARIDLCFVVKPKNGVYGSSFILP